MKAISDIEKLHAVYCQFTGFDLSMRYDRERSWYEFIKAGFTQEDLRLVLVHLKKGIKKKERHSGCLKFSNLVEPLPFFEEELCLAKAYSRNNQPQTNRQSVLKVFRPTLAESTGATVSCKPIKNIIPELLKRMREAAK